jgi:glyoxylase-like metal-dependent hydrolase (beta-lactamase superfamily II)
MLGGSISKEFVMTFSLSRRSTLRAALAAPALLTLPTLARADGHATGVTPHLARSFSLGDMTVTTLLDGSRSGIENPQGTFGMNATPEEFVAASEANFIPADSFTAFFTPTLVETGDDVILFDTGLGQGGLIKALAAAGKAPGDITVLVLTHMHPDHIGGAMTDGAPTFPNARIVTGQVEYDFWTGAGAGNRVGEMVASNVAPMAEKITFLGDGGAVASGVTAVAAFGHTPGHMGYMLESNGQQLMLAADLANHYVWSLAYPDWEVRFDADKAAAAASRRKILGMLAADKVPMIGYHMPFPAMGFIETRDSGFRFVPATYQLG